MKERPSTRPRRGQEARDREIGRRVAVKVVRTDRSQVPGRRQLAEAEVAGRLSHPNVVTLLEAGRSEKGAWIVQEFLVGRTLAARLAEGPMPVPRRCRRRWASREGSPTPTLSCTGI